MGGDPRLVAERQGIHLQMRHVVKHFVRQDEERLVEITEREDGLFSFQEYSRIWGRDGEPGWHPMRPAGLYETVEAAEREARSQIAWLKDHA
jgi:hypothetical protein